MTKVQRETVQWACRERRKDMEKSVLDTTAS